MYTLDIHDNFNGKLFCDHFSHVCVYDPELLGCGEIKLKYRGAEMGIVTVVAMRNFPFSRLSDMVSYTNSGLPNQKQGYYLNLEHNGGKTLAPDTEIMHIIFRYEKRNMEVQGPLVHDWWQSKNVNALS